ncbi:MAG: Ig-like domain-containing protein, partial [Gaiellales bacterium]
CQMPLTRKRATCGIACLLLALALVSTTSAAGANLNGGLTALGCVDLLANTCEAPAQAPDDLADAIVASPDGSDIYVVVDDEILDVRPAANGSMTFAGCSAESAVAGCTAQPAIDGTPQQLAISPDGRSAYLATSMHGTSGPSVSLVVFARDPASGALSLLQCSGAEPDAACPNLTPTHAEAAWRVAVSADGRFVDIAGEQWARGTYTLDSFARAGDGTLSEVGCLASQALAGCTTAPALSFTRAVVEAPGRSLVYAVGSESILTLDRDPSGALHEIGCLSGAATDDSSCQVVPAATTIDTMALSSDGLAAYALSGSQIWYLRAAPDGTLQDEGCGLNGQPVACQLNGLGSTAGNVALDGSMLYLSSGGWQPLYLDGSVGAVAGDAQLPGASAVATTRAAVFFYAGGSLYSFARVPPVAPICADSSVTVARPGGTISLQCTDPRGQPLRFTLDSPPSHGTIPATAVGTLGTFQLPYVPAAGSATSDSFTFHVDDGLAVDATRTVSISIEPAASAKPGTFVRARRQMALTLGRASTLRVRHGTTALTLRCGHVRCSGTVELRRADRTLVRSRFRSDRTGRVHVLLRIPRSIRPARSHRVHLRLRVTASAPGWRPHTVERAATLAVAPR